MKAALVITRDEQVVDANVTVLNGSDGTVTMMVHNSSRRWGHTVGNSETTIVFTKAQMLELLVALRGIVRVRLSGYGENKIEMIKWLREQTGKGLKDAKDTVEASVDVPFVVREFTSLAEAEAFVAAARTYNSYNGWDGTVHSYDASRFLTID